MISRRGLLAASAALSSTALLRTIRAARALEPAPPRVLTAAPADQNLAGPSFPSTGIWAYDGAAPGPLLSYRRGDRLRVRLDNALAEGTTIHFHGVRMPVAMDGVPGLTQPAVEPGRRFDYDFALPDAGTFWYHPHANSAEQVGRGLYGALVVAEDEPPPVDRDLLWVLDDWRLDQDARIVPFGDRHDQSHAGRLGNTATVNGDGAFVQTVRAGERVRLRLINVANARVFALAIEDHRPVVVALDGQPCVPHEPDSGRITIGPAQRADLILDMAAMPGAHVPIVDHYYESQRYKLADLVYDDGPPIRDNPLDATLRLPANPLPEPDLSTAETVEVAFAGGAMFGMSARAEDEAVVGFDLRAAAERGLFWGLNGRAHAHGDPRPPTLATIARGRTLRLVMRNVTEWDHPMHLHGHAFRVLSRDGRPVEHGEWRDTVLVAPHETVETAFVADNPGDWMFHCHVLEHQSTGMTALITVA